MLFDGIDREVYHSFGDTLRPPMAERKPRTLCGVSIPATTRVVTYVSRGFESMRGFDIFMRTAAVFPWEFSDVVFIVSVPTKWPTAVDSSYIGEAKTFKDWVLAREPLDLRQEFIFVGKIPPLDLAKLLATTDLHIYLTVPFVLSWSMLDAMSCGAVVLGSATPPVQEMIRDGENGLLANFFDADEFASKAIAVLKDPDGHRHLGKAAEQNDRRAIQHAHDCAEDAGFVSADGGARGGGVKVADLF